MARNEVEAKVLGVREVKRMLREMQMRAKDLSPAFRDFGDVFRLHNKAQFETEGLQGGRRWAPLSPRYAAWKLRTVGPKGILHLTGDLERSLTSKPMAIERIGPREATFGTNDPKAIWHQRPLRPGTPRRASLVVTRGLREELDRLIAAHVVGD